MKKFSNIAKVESPNQEPALIKNENKEYFELKMIIECLIDEYLHLRIEGPINPILQGTILIDGKNEFVDALIDSLTLVEEKRDLKVLESARRSYIISDSNWIEDQIKDKEQKINEYQTTVQITKHEEAIKDIYKSAKGIQKEAVEIAKKKAGRMKDGKRAFYRAMAAERLSAKNDKKTMLEIANVFMSKAKELGYSPQNSYFDKSAKKF